MTDAIATQAEGPFALAPILPRSEAQQMLDMIERLASDPSIDIARLDKILDMRERIERRSAEMAYTEALSEMQPKLPTVDRNGRIKIAVKADREKPEAEQRIDRSTPYALWEDINDAIKPALAEHGFGLSFRTGRTTEGLVTVTGILSHKGGHREETTMVLKIDSTGAKNDVQAVGSSISYGKRYTAGLLLNITSRVKPEADDDGAAAGALAKITAEQSEMLAGRLATINRTPKQFVEWFAKARKIKLSSLDDIPATLFDAASEAIEDTIADVVKRRSNAQGGT